jgi:hypothetical protein
MTDDNHLACAFKSELQHLKSHRSDCNDAQHGEQIEQDIRATKRCLYKAIHGHWFDCDLPDNWEGDS